MRRPSALAVLLVVGFAALASCARCTRDPAAAPERHLPPSRLAVVIPDLAEAQREARALMESAARFPAAAGLPEWLAALRAQLGFDPLTASGLESAGIDADGGAAWAETADGELLVLPVRDAAMFDATVARLARDRMGASHRAQAERGAARVVTLSRGPAAPAELAYAVAGGLAILARGPASPDVVARAAALEVKDTLSATPAWIAAHEALGRGHVAIAFRAPAAQGTKPAGLSALWRDGAALGVSGRAERLHGRGVLLLREERQQAWSEIAGAPLKASSEDLERLPRDAFLVGRFGGDAAPLLRRALWAMPDVAQALTRAGIDVERDLLPALAPGAAAAIALAPTFDVTAVSRGARDVALTDPFDSFHLAAFARVSSRERAQAAIEALAKGARKAGFAAAAGVEPGTWTFTSGGATVDVALGEDRLFFAGGPRRIDELRGLARSGDGWRGPTSGIRGLSSGGAGALVLDFGNLVRSARALPSSAYGSGPDAFVMRSIADRVLDPASRLEVAGVRVDVSEGAVRADFVVEAREGAEPRP